MHSSRGRGTINRNEGYDPCIMVIQEIVKRNLFVDKTAESISIPPRQYETKPFVIFFF